MTTRVELVAEFREWRDTRWHHQAALKQVGCDCIGLVAGGAKQRGIAEADAFFQDLLIKGYGRSPDPNVLLPACDRYLDRIVVAAIQPADILLMRFDKYPQHFAVVTGLTPITIIHAYAQARRVVEHSLNALWKSRIVRAYRFRGLT